MFDRFFAFRKKKMFSSLLDRHVLYFIKIFENRNSYKHGKIDTVSVRLLFSVVILLFYSFRKYSISNQFFRLLK